LRQQLKRYRHIQKNGGFPFIKTDKKFLLTGDSDSCLLNLKKNFVLSGDLKVDDNFIAFTDTVEKAVLNFQHRIMQTGIQINPTIPVYIAYFTAWVDMNGQLNFRNDLYSLDKKLSKEVFGD
jgi:hypothetical protein